MSGNVLLIAFHSVISLLHFVTSEEWAARRGFVAHTRNNHIDAYTWSCNTVDLIFNESNLSDCQKVCHLNNMVCKTYAWVELGARLAIEKENVGTFDGCGAVDFRYVFSVLHDTIGQRWFWQSGNESQLPDGRLGGNICTDVQCVDAWFDDIVVALWTALLAKIKDIWLDKSGGYNCTGFDRDDGDIIRHTWCHCSRALNRRVNGHPN